MKRLRTIVAVLIALAMAVAPMGSASASMRTVAPASHAAHVAEAPDTAAMDMTGCEKTIQQSGTGDCACCDTKSACPPELCLFKCFKVFSGIVTPAAVRVLTSLRLVPGEPHRPPDWIDSPQPPPPRT